MKEKLEFLRSKLEELQNVLKQNQTASKEIAENINIAEENKEKVDANILKLQGLIEGVQFCVGQVEEATKDLNASIEVEKKKGK